MFSDLMRRYIEHSSKSSQFFQIVPDLQHVVFDKVEEVLIMNAELEIEEKGVVENRRDNVLDYAVHSFNHTDQGATSNTRN